MVKTSYKTQLNNTDAKNYNNSKINSNSSSKNRAIGKKKIINSRNINNDIIQGRPNTIFRKSIKDIMLRIKKGNLTLDKNKSLYKSNNISTTKSMDKSNCRLNNMIRKISYPDLTNILKSKKPNSSNRKHMKIIKTNVIKLNSPNLYELDIEKNKKYSLNKTKTDKILQNINQIHIKNINKNNNIIHNIFNKNKTNENKSPTISNNSTKIKTLKVIKNKNTKSNNIPSTMVFFNKNIERNNKKKLANLQFNIKKSRNYDILEIFWHTTINQSLKKTNRYNELYNTIRLKNSLNKKNYGDDTIKKIPIIKKQIVNLNTNNIPSNSNSKKVIKSKQINERNCSPNKEKKDGATLYSINNIIKKNNSTCGKYLIKDKKKLRKSNKNLMNYCLNINQRIFDNNPKKEIDAYKQTKKK